MKVKKNHTAQLSPAIRSFYLQKTLEGHKIILQVCYKLVKSSLGKDLNSTLYLVNSRSYIILPIFFLQVKFNKCNLPRIMYESEVIGVLYVWVRPSKSTFETLSCKDDLNSILGLVLFLSNSSYWWIQFWCMLHHRNLAELEFLKNLWG